MNFKVRELQYTIIIAIAVFKLKVHSFMSMLAEKNVKTESSPIPAYVFWPIIIVGFVLAVSIVRQVWPGGPDYYLVYYPTGQNLLDGTTHLYDSNSEGYFNAPWAMLLIAPLSLLDFATSQAIWNVLGMYCLVASVHTFTRPNPVPVFVIALGLANPHIVDMLLRGQIDSFILAGVVLAWWAIRNQKPWILSIALTIMAMKPPNLLLVFILYLLSIRHWRHKDQITAISMPILMGILSAFVIGFDWPLRYLEHYANTPLIDYISITLWRGAEQIGLSPLPIVVIAILAIVAFVKQAWQEGLSDRTLCIAIATNLVFTTYANGNHYVLLVPAFLYLARHNWKLMLLAYLTTWTPFSRLIWGYGASTIDIIYAIILLLAAWAYLEDDTGDTASDQHPGEQPLRIDKGQ